MYSFVSWNCPQILQMETIFAQWWLSVGKVSGLAQPGLLLPREAVLEEMTPCSCYPGMLPSLIRRYHLSWWHNPIK